MYAFSRETCIVDKLIKMCSVEGLLVLCLPYSQFRNLGFRRWSWYFMLYLALKLSECDNNVEIFDALGNFDFCIIRYCYLICTPFWDIVSTSQDVPKIYWIYWFCCFICSFPITIFQGFMTTPIICLAFTIFVTQRPVFGYSFWGSLN